MGLVDGLTAPKSNVAFPLSLAGSILILLGGGIGIIMMSLASTCCQSIMGMMQGMMMGRMWFGIIMWGFVLGFASGILVLLGAIMLRVRPDKRRVWGTIIILFSVLSFLGTGGFFIGAILGIIGGALAIS